MKRRTHTRSADSTPIVWATAFVHLGTGLLWSWCLGPGTADERVHLCRLLFPGHHTYLRPRVEVEIHVRNHQLGRIRTWLCARRLCHGSERASYRGSGTECRSFRRAPQVQPSMRLHCHRNAVTTFLPGQAVRQVAIRRKSIAPKVELAPTPTLRGPGFESGTSAISLVLGGDWNDVDFRDLSGVYDSPRRRLHCSRVGLAWATCAEELQKACDNARLPGVRPVGRQIARFSLINPDHPPA